jgi:hypothetical protein
LSSLSDILVLDGEVLAYNTFNANCRHVLIINGFEVLALAFLYKGDSSVIKVNSATIKLKVVSGGETFMFLSQKLSFLKT